MRFSDRVRVRSLAVVAVLTVIGLGIPFLTRQQSDWDDVYRTAGRRLIAGDSLYPPGTNYAYPPLMAALSAPLANAPDKLARGIYFAINMGCIGILLRLAWRLTTSARMIYEPAIFWLGLLVAGPFLIHTLAHQQNDLIVVALVLVGCSAWSQMRIGTAATSFGLAAAMKCTPLLFAPYLLLKGRPFAAAWVVTVAIGANLLPDLVSRSNEESCHLMVWYERYLAPMVRGHRAPGVWASEVIYNQSLIGAANRWTQTTWQLEGGVTVVTVPSRVPVEELKRLQLGLAAGLGAAALMAMLRGRRNPQAAAWECGMICSAMLLLSPMSSVPHFVALLLPAWLLVRAAIRDGRRELWPFVAVMIVAAILSNKGLVGGRLYTLGLWYGSVMWGSVAAFAGCVVAMARPAVPSAITLPMPQTQIQHRRAA